MTEPTTGYHGLPPPTTAYREPTEHLPLVELGILELSNLARPEVGIFGETAIMLEFLYNGFHYYDSVFVSTGATSHTDDPILTDEVSKCAEGLWWKQFYYSELRRIDSVKNQLGVERFGTGNSSEE